MLGQETDERDERYREKFNTVGAETWRRVRGQ